MKKILLVMLLVIGSISLTGCSLNDEAYNVKHNIATEANNFGTYRKITVINLRSDNVLLEVEGYISIKDSTSKELAIIIRTGENEYKMHYVFIDSEIVYLVEQLENTNTDPYHWKIRLFAVKPDFEVGEK